VYAANSAKALRVAVTADASHNKRLVPIRKIMTHNTSMDAHVQHNKPLVPTRNGEAPLLAAQRRRWV
jgi:hypothetical protein